MNAVSTRMSNKIANLGFLCSLVVVLIHVDRPLSRGDIVSAAVDAVLAIAVPYFFLVSGYFLMRKSDEPGWWRSAVARRCRTLAIPYFVWLTVGLIAVAGADMLQNWFHGHALLAQMRGFCGSGRAFFGLRPDFPPGMLPLWYVRCLFMLVVLSPVIKFFLSRCLVPYFAALVFMTISVDWAFANGMLPLNTSLGRFLAFGFSVKGVLYFSVGSFLALRSGDLSSSALRFWRPRAMTSLVVGCVAAGCLLSDWTVVANALVLPCVLASAWLLTPAGTRWRVADMAFPIFLLHAIVIELYRPVAEHLHLSANWPNSLVMWLVCIVVSVLVAKGIRLFSKGAAQWLFGGRT